MTVMVAQENRPETRADDDLLIEVFLSLDTPEGYRAELIEGEIIVSPPPDGDHEDCISLIVQQVLKHSESQMQFSGNKGLVLPRAGLFPPNHMIPDLTFTPAELRLFRGAPPWMEPEGVAMVVEVTSSKPDRDRREKRRSYAQGRIPLYLLVDREKRLVTLYSDPMGLDYVGSLSATYGKPLPLPEPFGFELDTDFA